MRAYKYAYIRTRDVLLVDVIRVIDAEADAEGIKSPPPFRLIRQMDRERFNNSTRAALRRSLPRPSPGGIFFQRGVHLFGGRTASY
jgi:hypothetical protein